jgi:hypothetical protein
MALDESCKVVFEDSQVIWILLQSRGGKVDKACKEYGKAYDKVAKKQDAQNTKNYEKLRKELKEAIDSAREAYKTADETIEKDDGIIDILNQKYGKDAVKKEDQCKKAIDELKTAHDYFKDIKPIIDKAQKMYDSMKL